MMPQRRILKKRMRKLTSGGGWQAIRYALRKGKEVGYLRFWRAMRSKNACKTCALGMGGQLGGMRNEAGRFPEVCKKSLQAMAADMRGRIEPMFFETYSLAQLKELTSRELEMLGRLTQPVMAGPGDTHYRVVTWDEAFDHIAGSLRQTEPERSFFYSSGRSSNEAGFLMQLFARAYGTNHVNNCSYYCHQASGVGLKESIGSGTATVALEDLENCDLLFLIGGNPASNHPRLMTSLMKLRRRGGQVIVINPVRELGLNSFKVPSSIRSMLQGSSIASMYVQPTIGGDIALFAGIAKILIEKRQVDEGFIEAATENYAALEQYTGSLTWEQIERSSGVSKQTIEAVAGKYLESERAIFAWTMGITHHEHGVENVQWIVNLALLRGMVGKAGAGLMPIRGHSNVQGLGTIGVTPAISKAALDGLQSLGVQAPTFQGHDTMAAMEACGRGVIDFAFCLGGNLYGSNPDANFAATALGQVRTVVYLSTTMNTGHVHGSGGTTIILPVKARDEEHESTTQESMFNYVRLSDGGPTRFLGTKSEVDVMTEIAYRTLGSGGPLDWQALRSHDEIRKLIARLVPNLEEIENIGQTKHEFHIPGRVLRVPKFHTPTGKASFRPHPLPELPRLESNQLRLMTIRSEGQFNTVVYEEEDIYRGQDRRDIILISEVDMQRLGLEPDQRVNVSSSAGTLYHILVRPFDITAGCAAMYYPEANVLVTRAVDPRSKTPSFKSVIVTLESCEGAPPANGERLESLPHMAETRSNMKSC
jgi:molybdopterin-dependent oxidoreductase alpha subunit